MAQAKLFTVSKVRLLGRAALASLCLASASLCSASICNYPATAITNGNPVASYSFSYSPIVKGTVQVEYMTNLACTPYATYHWDALKGPYTVSALLGTPSYVRITVISADGSVAPGSVVLYLNPPAAPLLIRPSAPTGFKVL